MNKDYITIQDFRITEAGSGILIYGGSDYINVKRCRIYNIYDRGILSTYTGGNGDYHIYGGAPGDGNAIYNCGHDTTGADIEVTGSGANDYIISYNLLFATPDRTDGEPDDRGTDGIQIEFGSNHLIEYNEIYNHNDGYGSGAKGENGLDLKGTHNSIIRFNKIYNHNYEADIVCHMGARNLYIYGNSLSGGKNTGIVVMRNREITHDMENINIWSNLIYDHSDWGIWVSSYVNSEDPVWATYKIFNVNIVNNTFSKNSAGGVFLQIGDSSGNHKLINNIFYQNDSSPFEQVYSETSHAILQHNYFFWPSQTSKVYWNGSRQNPENISSGNIDGAPRGDTVPLKDPDNGDLRIPSGSAVIDEALDYNGAAGSITIQGTDFNLYWRDGLDQNQTNWSVFPLSVATLRQDLNGDGPEFGAYVYKALAIDPPAGLIIK